MTDKEFFAILPNLPKKRVSSGALVFNQDNQLLIVNPTYRSDGWLIPGGMSGANESPRQTCFREIKEEVGLDIKIGRLLCVDYVPDDGKHGEKIQYIFDGGILNSSEIEKIKLQEEELSEYRFVSLNEAVSFLHEKMKARLPECLDALKNNTAVYLESGETVD